MPLDPGKLDNNAEFINSDCMAKHIDDAVAQLTPLPSGLKPDVLKQLHLVQRNTWIGISTGIIEYLKAHESDFEVKITTIGSVDSATMNIL